MYGEAQLDLQQYVPNNFVERDEYNYVTVEVTQTILDILSKIPMNIIYQLSNDYDSVKQNLTQQQKMLLLQVTQYFDEQIKRNNFLQLSIMKLFIRILNQSSTTIYQQYNLWYQMLFIIHIPHLQQPQKKCNRLQFLFSEDQLHNLPSFINTNYNQFDFLYVFYAIQNIHLALQVIELMKLKISNNINEYA